MVVCVCSFFFLLLPLFGWAGGKPSSMTYILEKFAEQSSMDLATKQMPRILEVIKVPACGIFSFLFVLARNHAVPFCVFLRLFPCLKLNPPLLFFLPSLFSLSSRGPCRPTWWTCTPVT